MGGVYTHNVPFELLGLHLKIHFSRINSGKQKQHKHKLFGPDFPRTFLTFTPECPKFLPTTGAAGKRTFWCRRPRFSARTSMTRRVVEKLCTKKVCIDFLAPIIANPFPPETPSLSKICPGDCSWGFQSGGLKFGKICQNLSENYRFSKFDKFFQISVPLTGTPKNNCWDKSWTKIGVSGVFERCKGEKWFATLYISVILTPPITLNNFLGFNKRNSRENYTFLCCPS